MHFLCEIPTLQRVQKLFEIVMQHLNVEMEIVAEVGGTLTNGSEEEVDRVVLLPIIRYWIKIFAYLSRLQEERQMQRVVSTCHSLAWRLGYKREWVCEAVARHLQASLLKRPTSLTESTGIHTISATAPTSWDIRFVSECDDDELLTAFISKVIVPVVQSLCANIFALAQLEQAQRTSLAVASQGKRDSLGNTGTLGLSASPFVLNSADNNSVGSLTGGSIGRGGGSPSSAHQQTLHMEFRITEPLELALLKIHDLDSNLTLYKQVMDLIEFSVKHVNNPQRSIQACENIIEQVTKPLASSFLGLWGARSLSTSELEIYERLLAQVCFVGVNVRREGELKIVVLKSLGEVADQLYNVYRMALSSRSSQFSWLTRKCDAYLAYCSETADGVPIYGVDVLDQLTPDSAVSGFDIRLKNRLIHFILANVSVECVDADDYMTTVVNLSKSCEENGSHLSLKDLRDLLGSIFRGAESRCFFTDAKEERGRFSNAVLKMIRSAASVWSDDQRSAVAELMEMVRVLFIRLEVSPVESAEDGRSTRGYISSLQRDLVEKSGASASDVLALPRKPIRRISPAGDEAHFNLSLTTDTDGTLARIFDDIQTQVNDYLRTEDKGRKGSAAVDAVNLLNILSDYSCQQRT